MFKRIVRPLAGLAAAVVVCALVTSRPQAQGSITINFGNTFNGGAWPAGPDYATDVLGDPWDFCNEEDVAPDVSEIKGWANFSVNTSAPCVMGGRTELIQGPDGPYVDTQVSLLFRGRYPFNDTGRTGLSYPIDPSKYQKISYRMSDSAGGDNLRMIWFTIPWEDPAAPSCDSLQQGGGLRFADRSVKNWGIYAYDLTQELNAGCAWTSNGVVRGIRLSPTTGTVGQDVFFDWVRLTAPDNAPNAAMQTISWSGGSGSATIKVADASGTQFTIASGVNSPFSWNYGVLPPGSYTMTITRGSTTSSPKAFTINAPPILNVTQPNETGGEDYATKVLGDAWDMNSASDIQVTGFDGYTPTPPSISGGIATLTNTGDDPQITLLGGNNNGTPIDTSRYRYFTVRMMIEDPGHTREFGIGRVFWSPAQFLDANTASGTDDFAIWQGWHTYTLDLAPLTTGPGPGGLQPGSHELWQQAAMRHFRFDPSEFPDPRAIHIDYVKLAAMHETVNGGFTIEWANSSRPGTTVTLYYDSDKNPDNGKTLIPSGVPASSGQFFWNTAGVPAGTYWIYIEGNDGIQTLGRYSTGQLRVTTGTLAPDPAMSLDQPASGSTKTQPFTLSGWAIDRGASSGTGVDMVHVWAYPTSGASPIFTGAATVGGSRADIGNLFGSQFTNSGYTLQVNGLPAGTYNIVASAHSTVTGTFSQSRSTIVTIGSTQSDPLLALDSPANGTSVGATFTVSGWAVDRGASSGTGIDSVHIWAFPTNGGSAVFLNTASYGIARPDVGSLIGSQFTNSGYSQTVSSLPAGSYVIRAYAHSSVTGTFVLERSVTITVGAPASNPTMSIDGPGNGATVSRPFSISGWAVDLGSSSGPGVTTVHIWAYPAGGGPAVFVGQAAYGIARPDIATLFGGSQFTNSGFSLDVTPSMLTSGQTYDVVVFAYSSVANAFNQLRSVRITVN